MAAAAAAAGATGVATSLKYSWCSSRHRMRAREAEVGRRVHTAEGEAAQDLRLWQNQTV